MVKVAVPRALIPKLNAICPKCKSATRTLLSTSFAEGQHRRHRCRECHFTFYSLTPYDGTEPRTAGAPFKDRPLTEFEAYKRAEMIDEAERAFVTPEVTFETEVIAAIARSSQNRTPRQKAIMHVLSSAEVLINSKYPKDAQ